MLSKFIHIYLCWSRIPVCFTFPLEKQFYRIMKSSSACNMEWIHRNILVISHHQNSLVAKLEPNARRPEIGMHIIHRHSRTETISISRISLPALFRKCSSAMWFIHIKYDANKNDLFSINLFIFLHAFLFEGLAKVETDRAYICVSSEWYCRVVTHFRMRMLESRSQKIEIHQHCWIDAI